MSLRARVACLEKNPRPPAKPAAISPANRHMRWPTVDRASRPMEELPPFFQFQLVQRTVEELDANFVRPAPFTDAEQTFIERYLQESLGHPFRIRVRQVEQIARMPNGQNSGGFCVALLPS